MKGQGKWKEVWSDQFSANNLSPANWKVETGTGNNGWGNQELQHRRRIKPAGGKRRASDSGTVFSDTLEVDFVRVLKKDESKLQGSRPVKQNRKSGKRKEQVSGSIRKEKILDAGA